MKKTLSLILFSSLVTSAGIQAGWKWGYFWDSTLNQLLVGYGSLALITGLGSHCISASNQTNVNNALFDKKILKQIDRCIDYKKSTAILIDQVALLHITQNEKDSLVAAMQRYNGDVNTEAANVRTLINVHLAKVNVVLRYEKTGNNLIRHSKYALAGLLIYNLLIRNGALSDFIAGVQEGIRNSR